MAGIALTNQVQGPAAHACLGGDGACLVPAHEAAVRSGLAGSGIELSMEFPAASRDGSVDLGQFYGEAVTLPLGALLS